MTLKRETIRKLDEAVLAARDLEQVAGGYYVGKCTYPCPTDCP